MVNEIAHVFKTSDIGSDRGILIERKLARKVAQPLQAACSQDQACAVFRQLTSGGRAESAARPGDDNDLASYIVGHRAGKAESGTRP